MDVRNVFNIMLKDAKLSLRNMSLLIVIAIAIFLPVMMGAMMGAVTSSANETVMIGVFDRGDNHNYTAFLGTVPLYNVSVFGSLDQMNASIKSGAIVGGIEVPESFDRDIAAGAKPTLTLFTDPANFRSLIFTESCREITMQYAGLDYPIYVRTASVVPQPAGQSGPASYTGLTAPSLLLISILIVGVSVLPATLTTEKEKKTITALLATPVTQMEVIAGKSLFGLLVTVLITLIVVAVGGSWSGNLPLAVLFIVLGALAFNGVGLLIAMYANSYQTASILSSIVMVPLMLVTFLYGFIDALKVVGLVLPSTYLMNGLNDALIYDKGLADEWVNLLVFTAITAAIYVLIYLSLRRKGLAA